MSALQSRQFGARLCFINDETCISHHHTDENFLYKYLLERPSAGRQELRLFYNKSLMQQP
jgi:hypothetical protein